MIVTVVSLTLPRSTHEGKESGLMLTRNVLLSPIMWSSVIGISTVTFSTSAENITGIRFDGPQL